MILLFTELQHLLWFSSSYQCHTYASNFTPKGKYVQLKKLFFLREKPFHSSRIGNILILKYGLSMLLAPRDSILLS